MELSAISISVLLIYFSVTGIVTAFVVHSKMIPFLKFMWIVFIWILPFLGIFAWLLVQSFDHKFEMDGILRKETLN